eukprot:s6087_g2.t1
MRFFNAASAFLALLHAVKGSVPTFKVGVVSPDSGTGSNFFAGLEWWRDKINAQGGIVTQDGLVLQVELILVYSGATPDEAAQKVVDFYNGNPTFVHVLVNTFQQFNVAVNDAMREMLGFIAAPCGRVLH